jgi:hypothetical protein
MTYTETNSGKTDFDEEFDKNWSYYGDEDDNDKTSMQPQPVLPLGRLGCDLQWKKEEQKKCNE